MAIPNCKTRRGLGIGRGADGEVEELRVVQGVQVPRVENGGAGLEGLAGDVDRGHATPNDAVSLEDPNGEVEIRGRVAAEEVGHRGPTDAAADDANRSSSVAICICI